MQSRVSGVLIGIVVCASAVLTGCAGGSAGVSRSADAGIAVGAPTPVALNKQLLIVPQVGRLTLLCDDRGPSAISWRVERASEIVTTTSKSGTGRKTLDPGQLLLVPAKQPGSYRVKVVQDTLPERITAAFVVRTKKTGFCAVEQVTMNLQHKSHSPG